MKRIISSSFSFIFILSLTLSLYSCGSASQRDSYPSTFTDTINIRWNNDASGFLSINNDTDDDLILYAGSIYNPENILGGVRRKSERRIDFYDNLSADRGQFMLRAVKDSVYRGKAGWLVCDDVIFSILVTYDKINNRQIFVTVPEHTGGQAEALISNSTNFIVQFRVGRPDGEVLTTLLPLEMNKKIYMNYSSQGYLLFPVYQYYDLASNVRANAAQSIQDGIVIMPQLSGGSPVIQFDRLISIFQPFSRLIVSNENNRSAYLVRGDSYMTNQNGTQFINPGSEIYEINLNGQQSLDINNFYIDFRLGAANIIQIPEYTYEAGYTYQIRVELGRVPIITRLSRDRDTSIPRIELQNE
ncbi:MAG: hypothetical protein FWB83_05980 [Treponema sp.]|nr:hypothetical protein [Treponema sp.]